MFTRKQGNPYRGKRQHKILKMLGKASLFICWVGGQLPVQQTISFTAGWQSGGFTEAILTGKQKPTPPKAKKLPKARPSSLRCHTPSDKGDQRGAWGPMSPHCWGARWSCKALSLGAFPVLARPTHKWSSRSAVFSRHFYLGSFPKATWQRNRAGDTMVAQ